MALGEEKTKQWRPWLAFPMFFFVVACLVAVAFAVVDYCSLRSLLSSGRKLRVGMTPDDVRRAIGEPHAIGVGWFGDMMTRMPDDQDDIIWVYETMFDWDGRRSRWNPEFGLAYWWTRVSPSQHYEDEVLTVWLRRGKLIGVSRDWDGNIVQ